MRYAWIALVAATSAVAQPWVEPEEQARLEKLWPGEFEEGWKFYKPTKYSQRVAVTNGRPTIVMYHKNQDDHWTNAASAFNPNRDFPWAVSGGLHESTGWTSHTAIWFPDGGKLHLSRELVASRFDGRERYVWNYPIGTKFADLLVYDGRCFELRVREKKESGWTASTVYRGGTKPVGYTGPRKSCSECHNRAGEAIQYGITVRGSDTVFSFSPFKEGTLETWKDQ